MKKGRSKKRGEKEESKKVERWGKCEEGLEEGVLPEEVALTSSFPLKSGSPVCISTRIHPRLHMSMLRSYGIPSNTSGER